MDILLIGTQEGTQVRPASVHGMLWLQTHFEDAHWEALAFNQVKLPNTDAKILSEDAKEAGLRLNCLPALSNARKF